MTAELPTRKVDKEISVMITIMQRIHTEDPTGVLEEISARPGGTKLRKVCLPAELADNVSPPGLRRFYTNGLMDTKRLSRMALDEQRALLGEYSYAGQYMQSPVPLGGGMFKERYFQQFRPAAPYDCFRIRYWDKASTEDGGCFTAGVLLARDGDNNYYVEHVVHGQWEPVKRNEIMKATAERDRLRYGPAHEPQVYIEIEPGSSGKDAFRQDVKNLQGFPVFGDQVTGDKVVRAHPWSAQLAAGNVFMIHDGSWDLRAYVKEHTSFPLGRFKDQVDASSGAFNTMVKKNKEFGVRAYRGGPQLKGKTLLYVVAHDRLPLLVVKERSLLVSIGEPGNGTLPKHSLDGLMDSLTLCFADVDPAEVQHRWHQEHSHGKAPAELIIQREHGKKLWAFLLKKRAERPEVFVFSEKQGRRALSSAYAVADVLGLGRGVVYVPDDPDGNHAGKKAPNPHVYDTLKATRGAVVG